MKVLVCDDEPALRTALRRALTLDGYEVQLAPDGAAALEAARTSSSDAIVLDVLMPKVDGLEVCRRLRALHDDTPILLLTVRRRVSDIVAGLDAGADDYLTKPFALDELRARLRALLRRLIEDGRALQFADLTMDVATREVTRGERELSLTRTEFSLLEQLLRHPREVLTREMLFERVWGHDLGLASNSLEVYVGYLRRKLESGGEPRLLQTVRGVGYTLREPKGPTGMTRRWDITLRGRLMLVAGGAVALSIGLVAFMVFQAERHELSVIADADLRREAAVVAERLLTAPATTSIPADDLRGYRIYGQRVTEDGVVLRLHEQDLTLPVTPHVREVAAGTRNRFYADADVDGQSLRTLTVPLSDQALTVARSTDDLHEHLVQLGALLAVLGVAGVGIAAVLGALVARTALRPVTRLTEAAEQLASERSLRRRLHVRSNDELGRLGRRLNEMLDSLEVAQRSQRQLVADASHELRTPLTTLWTNLEVLERSDELSAEERTRLESDIRTEMSSLISAVDDLLDLARDDASDATTDELALDRLVEQAVEVAQRRWPQVRFRTQLQRCDVTADRSQVLRAVGNLLENAGKWSPAGAVVDVTLDDRELVVRDRGAGIPADELPHVFERFYRSSASRGLPGAGLGLAIVRKVADAHGWQVSGENAEDGARASGSGWSRKAPPC